MKVQFFCRPWALGRVTIQRNKTLNFRSFDVSNLKMWMQAVSSRDERAMETEESIISTVIVTTSPLYELFKLSYFHQLVLLVRSELRCNSPSPDSILSPHIGPYLLQY